MWSTDHHYSSNFYIYRLGITENKRLSKQKVNYDEREEEGMVFKKL